MTEDSDRDLPMFLDLHTHHTKSVSPLIYLGAILRIVVSVVYKDQDIQAHSSKDDSDYHYDALFDTIKNLPYMLQTEEP